MAKRNEWTVNYCAGHVADAAKAKCSHHEERLAHWQERMERAEAELKENGIELDEDRRNTSNNLQPRFNAVLWKTFSDCRDKVTEHRGKAQKFAAWERALTIASDRGQLVDLDVEDVEFFGL